MRRRTWFGSTLVALLALGALVMPAPVDAGCGCSKPPPPRAAVRPFVGYADQKIVLFSDLLVPNTAYWVQFTATADGSTDWSRGRAALRRDFAETVTQDGYQAGVGKDGTVYVPVDVSSVSDGTIFSGMANGFPLSFEARSVAMYNQQGFLMQLLDPTSPGLFRITRGGDTTSDALTYWRHEFRTYKQDHRRNDVHRTDDDPDWHADGTPHIDHDRIVVAISGMLMSGSRPAPGATAPFELVVQSVPSEAPLQ